MEFSSFLLDETVVKIKIKCVVKVGAKMKTIVKYVVLKSLDYQLGTPLFQEEIEADSQYFDQIPSLISFQNLQFKVKSKELKRIYLAEEQEDSQTIIVKVIAQA